ncbi:MAG: PepSY-associated TM helix domain-containing protein [Candidatus Acidiferrum sp.]
MCRRSLLFRIHLVGGLIAGLLFVILGLTGSIMAFEPEIDGWLHPSLFHVLPSAQPMPLTILSANVAARMRPDERIGIYILPTRPDKSCAFTLLGSGRLPRQVFVDEYSGRVLGSLSVVRFVLIVHAVHEASGAVMGCAAIILISSVVSGLYLWWPLKRIKVEFRSSARKLCFDAHNSVGFFSSVFLLVFAVTGTYMAFEGLTIPATYWLTGSKPLPEDPPSTPTPGAVPISADSALRVARIFLPTAVPLWVVIPGEKTTSYLVKMRFPEDHSFSGSSIVWIDQYSGKVLAAWSSRTAPLARRIEQANRNLHSGEIWGYPGRGLAAFMSMLLVIQSITGPYLWWKRRQGRRVSAVEPVSWG